MCLTMRELQALARKHRVSGGRETKQNLVFRLAIVPDIQDEAKEICRVEHGAQSDLTIQDLETFSTSDLRNYAKLEKIPGRSIAKTRKELIELIYSYRDEARKRIKRNSKLVKKTNEEESQEPNEEYDPEAKYRNYTSLHTVENLRATLKRLNGGIGVPIKYESATDSYIRTLDGTRFEVILNDDPAYFTLEQNEKVKELYKFAVILTGIKQQDGKNVEQSDYEEESMAMYADPREYYDRFMQEYLKQQKSYASSDANASVYLS